MTSSLKNYNSFDIVLVPFPFSDLNAQKVRPALILSSASHFNNKIHHSVMAMITSAEHSAWPLDVLISDHQKAGLPKSCLIRMKLFTLDHILIIRKIGTLSTKDQNLVRKTLIQLFD